jgi:pimeloyl-ACP methyl ester carboxylesterase
MGAAIAIMTAADEPAIRAVVADSPFAAAQDLVAQETDRKTDFPEWMVPYFIPGGSLLANLLFGIDLGALAPEVSVKALDYPVLLIHARTDDRIPVTHGERVHTAAPAGSVLWLTDAEEHARSFKDFPDEYVERVAAYFDARLGAAQTAPAQGVGAR